MEAVVKNGLRRPRGERRAIEQRQSIGNASPAFYWPRLETSSELRIARLAKRRPRGHDSIWGAFRVVQKSTNPGPQVPVPVS